MMKSTILCVGLAALILVFAGHSHAEIDKATIVGLWLMNEGSGEVAEDSSGNGNDGQFNGDPTWVDAKFGGGLEFDGTDDWLACGNGETLSFADSTNFSIHAIVKADGPPGGKCIAWKGLGCSTWSQWLLGTGEHENGVGVTNATFHIRNGNGGARTEVRAPDPLPEDEWVQVAGTYDGDKLRIYVNGDLANEQDASDPPWASPEQVYIGADPGCGMRCQWKGIIDEVAVFNVTLSDADVRSLVGGVEGGAAVDPVDKLSTLWGDLKEM